MLRPCPPRPRARPAKASRMGREQRHRVDPLRVLAEVGLQEVASAKDVDRAQPVAQLRGLVAAQPREQLAENSLHAAEALARAGAVAVAHRGGSLPEEANEPIEEQHKQPSRRARLDLHRLVALGGNRGTSSGDARVEPREPLVVLVRSLSIGSLLLSAATAVAAGTGAACATAEAADARVGTEEVAVVAAIGALPVSEDSAWLCALIWLMAASSWVNSPAASADTSRSAPACCWSGSRAP